MNGQARLPGSNPRPPSPVRKGEPSLTGNGVDYLIQTLVPVIANEEIAEGCRLLRLRAPEIAARAKPGQFLHLRVLPGSAAAGGWDPLLRRPLGILWARPDSGEVAVFYDVVGRGTSSLARVRVGEELDVLGPLGRGFEIAPTTRHALLIAGGIGVVPLVFLAEECVRRGIAVALVAGFRNAGRVFPPELLPAEIEYVVATDDGSRGFNGYAADAAREHLSWADQVFACGPTPMLRAVPKLGLDREKVQLSLEERMACGLGACLGCVVETRRGQQRVCRDGPVFGLSELGW